MPFLFCFTSLVESRAIGVIFFSGIDQRPSGDQLLAELCALLHDERVCEEKLVGLSSEILLLLLSPPSAHHLARQDTLVVTGHAQ